MTAMGPRHARTVRFLAIWFVRMLGDRVIVSSQCPVRLPPHFEPEPDLALLRPRADEYADAHPGPEDVLLLIEISDTTLRFDRGVKLPLYAAAGIPKAHGSWTCRATGCSSFESRTRGITSRV